MSKALLANLRDRVGERHAARRAAMRVSGPERVPAAMCVAALVTAAGTVTAVEVISRLLGRPLHEPLVDQTATALRELSWNRPPVLLATGALTVAGLVLLWLGMLPGRFALEPLRDCDAQVAAAITRAGLRRSLAAAALAVPGIGRVTVQLHGRIRRRVVVRATTHYRNPANLADLVDTAVTVRLEEIAPIRWRRVVVRLDWRRD